MYIRELGVIYAHDSFPKYLDFWRFLALYSEKCLTPFFTCNFWGLYTSHTKVMTYLESRGNSESETWILYAKKLF